MPYIKKELPNHLEKGVFRQTDFFGLLALKTKYLKGIFVIFNNWLLNVVMTKIDLVKASGLCWPKIDRRDRLGCGGKEIVL